MNPSHKPPRIPRFNYIPPDNELSTPSSPSVQDSNPDPTKNIFVVTALKYNTTNETNTQHIIPLEDSRLHDPMPKPPKYLIKL